MSTILVDQVDTRKKGQKRAKNGLLSAFWALFWGFWQGVSGDAKNGIFLKKLAFFFDFKIGF
jgi:hypothetical protein